MLISATSVRMNKENNCIYKKRVQKEQHCQISLDKIVPAAIGYMTHITN